MMGNAVRPAGDRPCDKTGEQAASQDFGNAASKEQARGKSFSDRVKDKAKGMFGK
jgi:hypothetical protein